MVCKVRFVAFCRTACTVEDCLCGFELHSIKDGAPRIGKLALGLTALRQEKANEILNAKALAASSKGGPNQAQSMDVIITEEFDG